MWHKSARTFSFSIEAKHIENWRQYWEPVILVIWDKSDDKLYWEILQDYFDDNEVKYANKKTINIKLHVDNILDNEGLQRIHKQTKKRFKRFDKEREGALVLISLLEIDV